tara:strand:- start:598 stop:813 length:216 start_codon:yes stop_codon:yes gene_type:complete
MGSFNEQVGGDHYRGMAVGVAEFAMLNKLSYLQGNVIKYTVRDKDNKIQDYQKAVHCLQMLIELEEREPDV